MSKKIKLATLFSGIGSVEWALRRLNYEYEQIFACDNGEVEVEIFPDTDTVLNQIRDLETVEQMKEVEEKIFKNTRKTNFVEKSYKANHNISDTNFHYDIRILDGYKYANKVDLLVGGSPCQSFSIMGYQRGLEDTRGTLFYDFARLVHEIQPKVFIYENVQGLLKHDKGVTWKVIQEIFNSLGYSYQFEILNSKNFGVPQNRNRLFVVGFKEEKFSKRFSFPIGKELEYTMQDLLIESCSYGNFRDGVAGFKKGKVEEKYFISEKVKSHVMSTGSKNYYVKPETDLKIARPLLATMHKMHRAGVDNYITVDGKLRRLTPRESLRLMGYCDTFKQVVSDTQMYRQAGNSIVVDIFIELIERIILTGVFN